MIKDELKSLDYEKDGQKLKHILDKLQEEFSKAGCPLNVHQLFEYYKEQLKVMILVMKMCVNGVHKIFIILIKVKD